MSPTSVPVPSFHDFECLLQRVYTLELALSEQQQWALAVSPHLSALVKGGLPSAPPAHY